MDSFLVINLNGSKTIRIKCKLYSPDKTNDVEATLIYDTGADKTSITREVLDFLGYTDFKMSTNKKRTALGEFTPFTCNVSEIIIGSQFKLRDMSVDVMEVKSSSSFDGVIGMDFISRVESTISGSKGTLTITSNL